MAQEIAPSRSGDRRIGRRSGTATLTGPSVCTGPRRTDSTLSFGAALARTATGRERVGLLVRRALRRVRLGLHEAGRHGVHGRSAGAELRTGEVHRRGRRARPRNLPARTSTGGVTGTGSRCCSPRRTAPPSSPAPRWSSPTARHHRSVAGCRMDVAGIACGTDRSPTRRRGGSSSRASTSTWHRGRGAGGARLPAGGRRTRRCFGWRSM